MEAPGIEPPRQDPKSVVSAAFPHVAVDANVQTLTDTYAEVRAVDDSRTNRPEDRARMMTNLAGDLQAALEAGALLRRYCVIASHVAVHPASRRARVKLRDLWGG